MLVINFQLVQPLAISAFYNPYEIEGKVCLTSNMVKSFDGEGDLMDWLAKVRLMVRDELLCGTGQQCPQY